MTKGSLRLGRDINHQIWQNSLFAMTQKVLGVMGHQLHICPTLHRIDHMYFFNLATPTLNQQATFFILPLFAIFSGFLEFWTHVIKTLKIKKIFKFFFQKKIISTFSKKLGKLFFLRIMMFLDFSYFRYFWHIWIEKN